MEKALIGLFKIRIRLCPLSLVGAYYLHPQMHVQNLGGGTNGKDPKINIRNQKLKTLISKN